jgi:hypothetical protein
MNVLPGVFAFGGKDKFGRKQHPKFGGERHLKFGRKAHP